MLSVRSESRAALLAYAYLRGRKYRDIERINRFPPGYDPIARLALKFGPYTGLKHEAMAENIKAWLEQA